MKPRQSKTKTTSRRAPFAICTVVFALVWIVFGQTLSHDFVNYDDKTYVYGNQLVASGLSWHGLAQAFVDTRTGNWHPLTLVSHMIDCQFFGLKAGGHHFTNVLLHSIASLLLFVFVWKITGRTYASGFVAALFAIHPLHVESVAWIAERKDVLSAVFFFLTLIAYVRYARAPNASPARTFGRYLTMSILFACGLMSKPMLVTTPVILLLLDYWPLARIGDQKSLWQVIIEKLPLVALSAASSVITFLIQERSVASLAQLPLNWRLQNAIVSYVIYIRQMFWPNDLAVFYPHPEDHIVIWQLAASVALLLIITALVFIFRQTRPYLLVGWLWYLVMLFPVIGVVQVGLQGHADRYTYLPQIGLYLMITWGIADLLKTSNIKHRTLNTEQKSLNSTFDVRRSALGVFCVVIVLSLALTARAQVSYWRNSETLWTHTLAVTRDNDVAHTNFGMFLMERGQFSDALAHFQTALDVRSRNSAHPHYALSLALIHSDIGNALARTRRLDDAIAHFRQAIELKPDYADAHYNLGVALLKKGEIENAIAEFRETLSIHPADEGAHTSLAIALMQKGAIAEAIQHYEAALAIDSDSAVALNNLAWILATSPDAAYRDGRRAVELASKAVQRDRGSFQFTRTLAAAYAEGGSFDQAIATAQRAALLAREEGARDLANQIDEEADLYRRQTPLRDSSLRNAQ